MDLKFNLFAFISISALIILIVVFKIYKLNSNDDNNVKLSPIWISGLIALIIGIGFQFYNFILVYDNIDINSEAENIAVMIKKSFYFSIGYFILFVSSIISFIILKIKKNK